MRFQGSLQPIILQVIGLLLLIAFVVIWVITGGESPLLVGAALTLVAVGSGTSAIITVRQEINVKEDDSDEPKDIHIQAAAPGTIIAPPPPPPVPRPPKQPHRRGRSR